LKQLTIIGGGLAGLAAGISLRHDGVPVHLIEGKSYPRHKVCGEFISGRGLGAFAKLGIDPAAIGRPVETISFHRGSCSSQPSTLPDSGVAIARFELDFALAREFVRLGGELTCPFRFESHLLNEGVVSATGRRLQAHSKFKWYGLKAHVTDVQTASDLELHFAENGYVGLCRIDRQRTNICGLFRRSAEECSSSGGIIEHFANVPSLRDRLQTARWQRESFAAVSGLSLNEAFSPDPDRFAIGDALSMIPPFTGNGMSVALESAELAVGPLSGYSRGELSWREAVDAYQSNARHRFGRRMQAATVVQKLSMKPLWTSLFLKAANSLPLWRGIFAVTR